MSQENLRKILKKLPFKFKQNEIDIIYKKISKKSNYIIHEQFNEILIELTRKIFPENYKKDEKYTVNYFFNILFECFDSLLLGEEGNNINYKYNTIMSFVSVAPNENQIMIIKDILYTINIIYEKYFYCEYSKDTNIILKSSKNLIEFSKDFEILPYILSETQIMTYYKLVIHYEQPYKFFDDNNNKGTVFTLNHFILYIIHASLYSFSKKYENISKNIAYNTSNESKLLLFLERLEASNGIMKFDKKFSITRIKKLSFIPSKDNYYKIGEISHKTGNFRKNKIISLLKNNKSYWL